MYGIRNNNGSIKEIRKYFEDDHDTSSIAASSNDPGPQLPLKIPALPLRVVKIDPDRVVSTSELRTPKIARGGLEVELNFYKRDGSSSCTIVTEPVFSSEEGDFSSSLNSSEASTSQSSLETPRGLESPRNLSQSLGSSNSKDKSIPSLNFRQMVEGAYPRSPRPQPLTSRSHSLNGTNLVEIFHLGNDTQFGGCVEIANSKKEIKFNRQVRIAIRRKNASLYRTEIVFKDILQKFEDFRNRTIYICLKEIYSASSNQKFSAAATSPRTKKITNNVLKAIQTSGILTSAITERISELKTYLLEYVRNTKQKTKWVVKLEKCFSHIINHEHRLIGFSSGLKELQDHKISALFENIFGSKWKPFSLVLEEWSNPEARGLIDEDLKKFNWEMLDLQNIYEQVLSISGIGAHGKNISKVSKNTILRNFREFVSSGIRELIIDNGKQQLKIQTLPLQSDNIASQKSFFHHFLTTYYTLSGLITTDDSVQRQVESLFDSDSVQYHELLWLCVEPWKRFKEKVRVIFAALFHQIDFVLEKNNFAMTIMVEENVPPKITLAVNYRCYSVSKKGAREEMVANIPFYWTVIPNADQLWPDLWSGCIQIPNSIESIQDVPFHKTWGILLKLKHFSEIDDPDIFQSKSVITHSDDIAKYMSKLKKTLDSPSAFPEAEYVSWFTLEEGVKELMWQCPDMENIPDREVFVVQVSNVNWLRVKADERVIAPLKTRLRQFQVKLDDYVKSQESRVRGIDQWFSVLKEMIEAKELEPFLNALERYSEDTVIFPMILHIMCGGWQGENGTINSSCQNEHIYEILKTLYMLKDPQTFIDPTTEILRSVHYPTKLIKDTSYEWEFSRDKIDAIFAVDAQEIVRTFIPEGCAIKRLEINGKLIDGSSKVSTKLAKQAEYFGKILSAIYEIWGTTEFTSKSLQQAELLCSLKSYPKDILSKIPALTILQLSSISTCQNGDRFFRHLFNLNNPPLKTSISQNNSCKLSIDANHVVATHEFVEEIYPRGIPELFNSAADKDRLIARIPVSWKLTHTLGSPSITGQLIIHEIEITPNATNEERYLISNAFANANTTFMENGEWEFQIPIPVLKSPLGISEAIRESFPVPEYVKRLNPSSQDSKVKKK